MIWLALIFGIVGIGAFVWYLFLKKANNEDDEDDGSLIVGGIAISFWLIAVIVFILSCLTIVPAGHVGVSIIFGKVQKKIISEGLHTKNIFASVVKMTTQTQSYTMSEKDKSDMISALTKDNLTVEMDITVLYKLEASAAPEIYRILGTTDIYTEKIIRPSIRTAIRNSVANYNASEVMSSLREKVEKNIEEELRKILDDYFSQRKIGRGILIERVLLRNVNPPDKLKEAIQAKLEAEQEAQKMTFILQKEQMEARRKIVEAEGIANAQRIIAKSLTKEYLQWYYLQTLKQLVNSPNNSTIILPFDQKLTPMLPVK